ncbi:hypothetical protein KSS87_003502, partial [Heliosperma pusillum]
PFNFFFASFFPLFPILLHIRFSLLFLLFPFLLQFFLLLPLLLHIYISIINITIAVQLLDLINIINYSLHIYICLPCDFVGTKLPNFTLKQVRRKNKHISIHLVKYLEVKKPCHAIFG